MILARISGNPPETSRGGSPGGLRIFWLKSLANPDKIFKKIFFCIFLKILSGFASDLAKKSGDPPRGVSGGSPDDFRWDNIDGPHGMNTVLKMNVLYQILLFLFP